jgi:ABC-type iron transport system FetAB permease component
MTDSPGALPISNDRLALAALLILANVARSAGLRLGLGRSLLVGLAMATIVGHAAVNRTRHRFAGIYLDRLLSVMGSSALVTGLAITGIIRSDPWFSPQVLIPLLGMVLGNSLNGISLGLDRLMEGLEGRRELVETALALGASRWEACREVIREAISVAMTHHHQLDDGDGSGEPGGDDHRSDPGECGTHGSSALPDRDHLHDRVRHRPGGVQRGAAGLVAAHQR